MTRQPLLVLGMLFLGIPAIYTGTALAQPSPNVGALEACRSTANETLQSLETKQKDLEASIARAGQRQTPTLRKAQEDLIEVQFQIECLSKVEPAVQKRSVAKRSVASGRPKDIVEVTTYYATNRNKTGNVEVASTYGPNPGDFHYGRAVVSIPSAHKPGEIELPSMWKLELEPDPNRHFILRSVTPLELDAARKEMADKIKSSKSKAVLLFVHGYNSGFGDAAMRTAQLAYDLKFPGMPFFYSWPSAGRVRAYLTDEESARLSEIAFETLIEDLSQLPVTDVYIVAHSMGTRIVAHGLQHRIEQNKSNKHVRELLLAAPDINAELFRTTIAPKLASLASLRTTVYASSSDLALRASKVVHGFQRLGETTGGVLTYKGVETIDASAASSSSRALGHSYIVDTPSVLDDIKSVILNKAIPSARGLSEAGVSPNVYWRLVK